MLDIGFMEMATIGVVALVVIGPERLPAVAAKVGRYVGKLQRFVRGVRSDISRELETGDLKKLIGDQKEQINELRSMVTDATKDLQASTKDTFKEVESSMGDLKKSMTEDGASESRVDDIKSVENEPELLNDSGVSNQIAELDANDDASQQNNKAS